MPRLKKAELKITMLETEKEELRRLSKHFAFSTMSGFVLALIREKITQDSLTLSREIIQTFDRLYEFESNSKTLSKIKKDHRRELATKTRNKLLQLCSDGTAP